MNADRLGNPINCRIALFFYRQDGLAYHKMKIKNEEVAYEKDPFLE